MEVLALSVYHSSWCSHYQCPFLTLGNVAHTDNMAFSKSSSLWKQKNWHYISLWVYPNWNATGQNHHPSPSDRGRNSAEQQCIMSWKSSGPLLTNSLPVCETLRVCGFKTSDFFQSILFKLSETDKIKEITTLCPYDSFLTEKKTFTLQSHIFFFSVMSVTTGKNSIVFINNMI